jgi:hypothetical protein
VVAKSPLLKLLPFRRHHDQTFRTRFESPVCELELINNDNQNKKEIKPQAFNDPVQI